MSFIKDEVGTTSLEYVLITVLVSVSIISGISFLGNTVSSSLQNTADNLTEEQGNAGNRSGLGDGTNPGQGGGRDNSPNEGTNNPGQGGPWP